MFWNKLWANAQRVGLSALKAGAATSVAYAIAHQTGDVSNVTQLEGLGLAALVAGLDAGLKVVQIALEKSEPAPVPVVKAPAPTPVQTVPAPPAT